MSLETLYTVGHSNLQQSDFVALLQAWEIATLVDIRAYPRSRRFPYFDCEPLQAALEQAGIAYQWAGRQLGGMRKAANTSPHVTLGDGLRGYADHQRSEEFIRGVSQLLDLVRVQRVTVMCAEREPLHCHRSLLADHLLSQHAVEVRHLLSATRSRAHELRAEARVVENGIVYDRHAQSELDL